MTKTQTPQEVARLNLRSYDMDPKTLASITWREMLALVDYKRLKPRFFHDLLVDYTSLTEEFERSRNWRVGFALYWATSEDGGWTRMDCRDLTPIHRDVTIYKIEYVIDEQEYCTDRFLVITRVHTPEE